MSCPIDGCQCSASTTYKKKSCGVRGCQCPIYTKSLNGFCWPHEQQFSSKNVRAPVFKRRAAPRCEVELRCGHSGFEGVSDCKICRIQLFWRRKICPGLRCDIRLEGDQATCISCKKQQQVKHEGVSFDPSHVKRVSVPSYLAEIFALLQPSHVQH